MATYECESCGMAVTISCSKCGKELSHDTLQVENGISVQISVCGDCKGKVKSPQCCGEDMACSI